MSGIGTRAAYNLVLCGAIVAASPFLAVKAIAGRSRSIALSRLGLGAGWKPPRTASRPVWVHALSVGEVASALPLVKRLIEELGPEKVAMSASTAQGLATARQGLGDKFGNLFARTLDLPWLTHSVVGRLEPGLFILVEGDVWPNLQWSLATRSVPSMLVNGRISTRSARRMGRLPGLAKMLYGDFTAISMQSAADSRRLAGLGMEPGRITALGNLKYDSVAAPLDPDEKTKLAARLGLAGRRVLAAGSTHQGEEAVCLEAFKSLAEDRPELCLLIAPRNTQRGAEVFELATRLGLRAARTSRERPDRQCSVVVLDEMGLLARAYGLAEAAMVGGSLVEEGGHNPLEPAAQGVATAMGPHMEDFSDMAANLLEAGAARTIYNVKDLTRFWREMLDDQKAATAMGRAGLREAGQNRGSVDRTLEAAMSLYQRENNG